MSITDGNPTIDPAIITQAVSQGVAQGVQQIQRMNLASEKKESRFQQKVKSLLDTQNIDKDNLSTITDLIDAKAADVQETMQSTAGGVDPKVTYARCSEAIQDALEKYTEGDKQLEKASKDLQTRVEAMIMADPATMQAYQNGVLDKRKIREMSKEAVEVFEKDILDRDSKSKGPAITSGVPGNVAAKAIENAPAGGSIDEITDPGRREAYFKLNALYKRNRIPAEEAHNKAFAMATKQFKKAGSAA